MSVQILIGDCRERMKELPDASVDSVVCDPPYGLEFMGKEWDTFKTGRSAKYAKGGELDQQNIASRKGKGGAGPSYVNRPARRCAKCGKQAWSGSPCQCPDPEWTIDNSPLHGFQAWTETWAREVLRVLKPGGHMVAFSGTRTYHRMVCAIEDAGFEIRDCIFWAYGQGFPKSLNVGNGLGTALKPAVEPICLARKPLIGSVAANVLVHGTGALNIDAARIGMSDEDKAAINAKHAGMDEASYQRPAGVSLQLSTNPMPLQKAEAHELGRWPANLCHDGSDEVLAGFPETQDGVAVRSRSGGKNIFSDKDKPPLEDMGYGGGGSAARFFYCAKATTEERGEGNSHPTVKPVALMRWLCRLVTPKGGTILDPFMGSGSTGLAADAEQFNFIGCELSAEYAEIARKRIADQAGMFADIEMVHSVDARAA